LPILINSTSDEILSLLYNNSVPIQPYLLNNEKFYLLIF
jgi:hypothetical protein